MTAPRDHRRFPLRLNAPRFEAFLRGGPRAGTIALHRKIDGGALANGAWRFVGDAVHLQLAAPARAGAGLRAALAELAPLLARAFPRARLHIGVTLGRRRLATPLAGRGGPPFRAGGEPAAGPAAARAAIAAVLREVPGDYGTTRALPRVAEARVLALAGTDLSGRECWLHPDAAHRWRALRMQAARDGVWMELVSGFRSAAYQARILERKRARGEPMDRILAVNAAPGFSEHHAGVAVDLGAPGLPPVEVSFEQTPAFRWLAANAAALRLRMSYPRDNPHGILYEPWHWRFLP
ncbi:MAG: D-alanyl-D-alanine carboxypeptidase family protein [Pseudomonadota bacterium]